MKLRTSILAVALVLAIPFAIQAESESPSKTPTTETLGVQSVDSAEADCTVAVAEVEPFDTAPNSASYSNWLCGSCSDSPCAGEPVLSRCFKGITNELGWCNDPSASQFCPSPESQRLRCTCTDFGWFY